MYVYFSPLLMGIIIRFYLTLSFLIIAAKCRISDLRAHYKNTYEVARSTKGMKLKKAIHYMDNCLEHKQIIPFRRYTGGVGRHAQAKEFKHTQGRWPEKSVRAGCFLRINFEMRPSTATLYRAAPDRESR